MKRNVLFIAMSILATVLLMSLASATITLNSNTAELSQTGNSFTVSVTSNETETITVTATSVTGDGQTITFIGETIAVTNGTQTDFNITYNPTSFDFELGETYTTTVTINGTISEAITTDISFEETTFCGSTDNDANIKLNIEDINVISGFGDDDDYWYLMDEVEIELTIEPTTYDIEDVEIEWVLYNTAGTKIDDGDFSVSDIDEDDEETVTFTIVLDSNLDDFEGEDARLYVKAFGDIDDNSAGSNDGSRSCDSEMKEVDVITNDDFVIPTFVKVNNEKIVSSYAYASCEDDVTINFEVFNIGEDDQDDVSIEIYSKGLEVYEKFDYDEIRAFDSEEIEYTFKVPEGMDEGKSLLTIEVFDEDGDLFENDEDDESKITVQFMIEGNCKIVEPQVYAKLDSEAISGRETIITATITNMEEGAKLYTIVPEDYSEWSVMTEFSPQVLSLEAGESADVTFKLKLNSDIEGERTFNIVIMDGDRTTVVQPMTFNVEKGLFNVKDFMTRENLQIAGIVALNLILLIAIILVARKIIRKK